MALVCGECGSFANVLVCVFGGGYPLLSSKPNFDTFPICKRGNKGNPAVNRSQPSQVFGGAGFDEADSWQWFQCSSNGVIVHNFESFLFHPTQLIFYDSCLVRPGERIPHVPAQLMMNLHKLQGMQVGLHGDTQAASQCWIQRFMTFARVMCRLLCAPLCLPNIYIYI